MQGRFLTVAILVLGALVGELHWVIKPQPSENDIAQASSIWSGQSWVGRMAPDFELQTTKGESFKLSDQVGQKVIVLNFFATWCGPCQAEMPELVRYSNKHTKDPVVILGVDADEKPLPVNDFIGKYEVRYPVAIDPGSVERAYGIGAFPTTVLIGVDGKIEFYHTGALTNADVALDMFLSSNRRMLESGGAITKDEYLSRLERVTSPSRRAASPKTSPLTDRGRRIAALMDCPCGCDKRVEACTCHTAANIKRELAATSFKNLTDSEIIKRLDRKYCMAGM
jgi:peroxiredoxin